MRITDLLQANGIPFDTDGKDCSPGWISVKCVWCDDPAAHLGYNLSRGYFHCWRCGWHPTATTISKLLQITILEARQLVKEYGGASRMPPPPARKPRIKAFKYPVGTRELTERHRKYLIKRNFDPDKIEREWGLLGTGPIGFLDELDYKHRIVAPIFWDGQPVSFQARDITGKSELRYKACPMERELILHKHILYGQQDKWGRTGIVVEGITDVWRLGVNACGTFGTKFTDKQIREIARHFRRVILLFDGENPAQKQAEKLVGDLKMYGTQAEQMRIVGDPADMKQDDADHLVKEIMR